MEEYRNQKSGEAPRSLLPYLLAFILIVLILAAALYLSSTGRHRMSIGPFLPVLSTA